MVAQSTSVFFAAAGVLHISSAADHSDVPVMLAGFIAAATLQLGFAAFLLRRRPDPLLIVAATALTVLAIGTWLVSRTRGLPFVDDGHVEPIGFTDALAVVFELGSLPGLLLLGSRELGALRLPSTRLGTSTVAGLAAGALALLVPALVLGGGGHHSVAGEHGAAGHTHGDGEGDDAKGSKLASARAGKHHPGRRGGAASSAGDQPAHRQGHTGGGSNGAEHSGGSHQGTGSGGGSAGTHGEGGGHQPRGDQRHTGGGGNSGDGDGGHGKGGHGDGGQGNGGGRNDGGGHGKGGHGKGETAPEHGGHGGEEAPPPAPLPTGEPLQRICNEAGVCIP